MGGEPGSVGDGAGCALGKLRRFRLLGDRSLYMVGGLVSLLLCSFNT